MVCYGGYITRILLFELNYVLKSLLSAFSHLPIHKMLQTCKSMRKISNEFYFIREIYLTIILFW